MSTVDPATYDKLMSELTTLSIAAARAILHAQAEARVRIKADGSPVTPADEASEAVIREGLTQLAPALPIVSEEQVESQKQKIDGSYFLVDPLDGTREFIAGRDEYTVNIALIADGAPVLGIIAAPASGLIWRGIVGRGAERLPFTGDQALPAQPIRTRARLRDELIVMVSRSHLEARTRAYLDGFPDAKLVQCGSSVKLCRVAEGSADLYARLAPTHDWDIAAGDAILTAAGGSMIAPDGARPVYGTAELLVPAFLAWGDPRSAARITG